jgi:acetyltransferase-like isoleucine patch superfamily enzyme
VSESTFLLYENVSIGLDPHIGEFVIIGKTPIKHKSGDLPTSIGDNAIIRSHTVIYAGTSIGDQFQTGHHALVREKNSIGNRVSIGTNSVIEHNTQIGDGVRIHSNCFIPEYSVLKSNSWLGPGVILTNAKYPQSENIKESLIGPTIERGAIIGAGVVILPGVSIGKFALVGAGTTIVEDVPEFAVVAGNPPTIIASTKDLPEYAKRISDFEG